MIHKFPRMLAVVAVVLIAAIQVPAPTLGRSRFASIFPFAAGGSGDALARHIAEGLRTALDQPVIVENRTGAQGRLGVQAVKAAAPDGKTLLLTPVAPMSVYAHVYKALLYDPVADFEPVSQVATFDFAIAVGPQVPAKSLKELVAWVKANPAQGNYGTPAAGTLPHFFAVSFAKTAGLDLRHVGYRGSAAALTDLDRAGRSPSWSPPPATFWSSTRPAASGCWPPPTRRARRSCPISRPSRRPATTSRAAAGTASTRRPRRRPTLSRRLNKAIVAAVQSPPVKEKLLAFGLVPTGTSAAELRKIQKRRLRALGAGRESVRLHAGAVVRSLMSSRRQLSADRSCG